MNKQELLENYTTEQLAEMVAGLRTELAAKENILKTKYAKCEISEDGDILQVVCAKCGEKFIAFLEDKYLLCTKAKFFGIQDANRQLNKDVERLQTTINQIDDILNELLGVTHDVAKPDDMKGILRAKLDNMTYFPEEPLKVADLIITGWKNSWNYKHFNLSELRQIAEHLLVYCNANVEGEE